MAVNATQDQHGEQHEQNELKSTCLRDLNLLACLLGSEIIKESQSKDININRITYHML